MFSKSDITFNYVLISTRDNGEVIKSMPALYYFNRLLVAARFDRDTVWFDPAYRGVPWESYRSKIKLSMVCLSKTKPTVL
jgi:hypothetical protein